MRYKTGYLCILLMALALALLPGGAAAGQQEDIRAGLAALNQGHFAKAADHFTKAINTKDPGALPGSQATLYLYRSMAYAQMGKLEKAVDDFEQTLTLMKADAMASRIAKLRIPAKPPEPPTAVSWAAKGAQAKDDGDCQAAVEFFTKSITTEPNTMPPCPQASVYRNRAECYRRLGQMEAANQDMAAANKMCAESVTQSTQTVKTERAPKPAPARPTADSPAAADPEIAALEAKMKITPPSKALGKLLAQRAELYYAKGNKGKAIADLNAAIRLDPKAQEYRARLKEWGGEILP